MTTYYMTAGLLPYDIGSTGPSTSYYYGAAGIIPDDSSALLSGKQGCITMKIGIRMGYKK